MDLLFKRYASPFLLTDQMIRTSTFAEFVSELIRITNEEKEWEVWMHRAKDKTYDEFQREIGSPITTQEERTKKEDLEAIIKDSNNILDSFNPS